MNRLNLVVLLAAVLAGVVGCANNAETEAKPAGPLICNGYESLCDKTYNQVAYATSHNAMSNEDEDFIAPNQIHGIEWQLEHGIRGLMLDTYIEDGVQQLCHGACGLGSRDTIEAYTAIREFMEANTDAIVTFLLQETTTEAQTIEALQQSGLDALLFDFQGTWPTLGTMVESNQRLVLLSQDHGSATGTYLYMWDLVWDTPYVHNSVEELAADCEHNRGTEGNDLLLINHWLYEVPLPSTADQVNYNPFLLERVQKCQAEMGQIPNFIALNFVSLSDVVAVVDTLNGVSAP